MDNYLEAIKSPKFLWVLQREDSFYRTSYDFYSSHDIMDVEVHGKISSPEIRYIKLIGAKQLYPSLMKDITLLDNYNNGKNRRRWTCGKGKAEPHKLIRTDNCLPGTKFSLTSTIFPRDFPESKENEVFFRCLDEEIKTIITYQDKFPEVMRTDFRPKAA